MSWDRYKTQPSFVLGFHGCDRAVAERVFAGGELEASTNPHDWLGGGIYFWESNPQRALQWANEAKLRPALSKGKINEPDVVGAIVDLGLCFTLFDTTAMSELARAHQMLKWSHDVAGTRMPENTGGEIAARRFLDCAVIEYLHELRKEEQLPPYDVVRAAFSEGGPAFPQSRLTMKNHVQLAVRNPRRCIKGYFRPLPGG